MGEVDADAFGATAIVLMLVAMIAGAASFYPEWFPVHDGVYSASLGLWVAGFALLAVTIYHDPDESNQNFTLPQHGVYGLFFASIILYPIGTVPGISPKAVSTACLATAVVTFCCSGLLYHLEETPSQRAPEGGGF